MTQHYIALAAAPHLAQELRRASEARVVAFAEALDVVRRGMDAVATAIARPVEGIAARIARRPARARAIAELEALDDHLLEDIGLRRGDIREAVVIGRSLAPNSGAVVLPFTPPGDRAPGAEPAAARQTEAA